MSREIRANSQYDDEFTLSVVVDKEDVAVVTTRGHTVYISRERARKLAEAILHALEDDIVSV